MTRFLISLSLATSVLGGHSSYQGEQNMKFSLTADYSSYSDSVAGCCFHCNKLSSERVSHRLQSNVPLQIVKDW